MFMDMIIRLPRDAASSPLRIPSFRLDSNGLDIVVDDLADGVIFDTIQLTSDKATITVEVSCTTCIHTIADHIIGHSRLTPDRLWCIPPKAPFVALSTYPAT